MHPATDDGGRGWVRLFFFGPHRGNL